MSIAPISSPHPSEVVNQAPAVSVSKSDTDSAAATELKTAPPALANLQEAANHLNQLAGSNNNSLSFQVDDSTGKTVIKVMDANHEIIRQIPSEEALALSRAIDSQQGLVLKTKI